MEVSMTDDGGAQLRNCPYCRHPLDKGVLMVGCGSCSSTHHADCWNAHQGCAVTGCASGPGLQTRQIHVATPDDLSTAPQQPLASLSSVGAQSQQQLAVHGAKARGKVSIPDTAPMYGSATRISFREAVEEGFQLALKPHGRSSRRAFWFWMLFAGMCFVLPVIFVITSRHLLDFLNLWTWYDSWEYRLSLQLGLASYMLLQGVSLTVSVRRAHDAGKTAFWAVLGFGGWAIVLMLMLLASADVFFAFSNENDMQVGGLMIASLIGFVGTLAVGCRKSVPANRWGKPHQ